MHALVLAHTCAHACIVAHMDLYIIVMAYCHTLKYTVHMHIPDGYTCMMWHTINKSVTDGTHTHKHCDMHMHSIPFIQLLMCMFVQATDLMYCVLSSVQVFLLTTTLCAC